MSALDVVDVTTCRGATCGAAIQWQITAAGKRTPVNLDGSPHWATCPDVARFKSARTKVPTLFDTTTSTKDRSMTTEITKATDAMHDAKNGKTKATIDTSRDVLPAPKSEASEVLAAAPAAVPVERADDEAPSVMATAMKIVKLLEKHRSDDERGRVLLCVVAGSGMSGLGSIAGAVRGTSTP